MINFDLIFFQFKTQLIMQSEKNYKCGNCGAIVELTFFGNNLDNRKNCPTCGPLCEDCVDGGGMFSNDECKGCGNNKLKAEKFRAGGWE